MGPFDFFKKNKTITRSNGLCEIYYNNGRGKLKERFHQKHWQKDGAYQLYYEDGITIKEEGYYRPGSTSDKGWRGSGIKIGLHKTYYKNGKLESVIDCDLGDDESYKQYFEENGQLECEYNKKEDFKKVFDINGQLKIEKRWNSNLPFILWRMKKYKFK
jgi:antitoxin component YwqK of YwqJK toxin-antitoxin module